MSPELQAELGNLVRSMNCYYSNLIEGHATHPVDIDRALTGEYAENKEKRNLQLEAVAHITVQTLIDRGKAPFPVLSVDFIKWLHRSFCKLLPDELLWATNPDTGKRSKVVPGEFRHEHVMIGRHLAPDPVLIEELLEQLVSGYASVPLAERGTAAAASHHRLLWIHPFLDGNGRVARLFTHALLREWGIGSELWSVSRGFARKVGEYKAALMEADEPRRGDLDGRGNLSEAGLESFCGYFLDTCLDQVRFMRGLLQTDELLNRVRLWTDEEVAMKRLPSGAWPLLREALLVGSFERGRAADLTGYAERQARTVLTSLTRAGLLVSEGPKMAVRIRFAPAVVERWLPGLYPTAP